MMNYKRVLFVYILLFSYFFCFAQQSKIDSLQTLLKKDKDDTSIIIHLNKLTIEYIKAGIYDSAMLYAKHAIQLSNVKLKENKDPKIKQTIQKNQASSYNNLGLIYWNQYDNRNALDNHLKALKIREEIGDKKGIADSHNNIGLIYWNQGDYQKAMENYWKALKIREEIGDKKGKADSYYNIGVIYENQGNYKDALINHLKALKIGEEIGNKKRIADSYNNIGVIHFHQGNYEKALDNYFKSLKIRQEIGDKSGMTGSYNNIGNIYFSKNNYERALDNFLNSLKIQKEIKDKRGMAISYSNIGSVYEKQKNYEKALSNSLTSLKIQQEIGDKLGIAASYNNIGAIYIKQGKFEKSYNYLNQGLILFKEIGSKSNIKDSYSVLSELFDKEGDYKQAYYYHKLYSDIKDSLLNDQSAKQIAELQIKYETEKKEKENQLLEQKNRIQQTEIVREKEKRNGQITIVISAFTFVTFFFMLLYYRNKLKQKAVMEKEINLQQKFRFKEVIDSEEKERRRIAQELHDGLGQLLSTVKLNISAAENFIDDSAKEPFNNSLSLIDTACDEVRSISHNLMPGVLIRLGLLSAIRELVRKINISKQIAIEMETNFDERLNESAEVAIYRIIQEIMNNIIKHSEAKVVALILNRSGEDFFIQVTNDGRGFDTSLIDSSEGIGWKNIYSRSAMFNGTVDIRSSISSGTTVKIYFPKLFSDI